MIRDEPWRLRFIRGFDGGALWLLLPEREYQAESGRVLRRLLGSLAAVALVVIAGWLLVRPRT